jgi:hypothetical protein
VTVFHRRGGFASRRRRAAGGVDIFSFAAAHVIVDVVGYFA